MKTPENPTKESYSLVERFWQTVCAFNWLSAQVSRNRRISQKVNDGWFVAQEPKSKYLQSRIALPVSDNLPETLEE